MPARFVAIGELLADFISTEYCTDLSEAKSFAMLTGGSPANVAANLSFLGIPSALISCVGNDGVGRMLVNAIRAAGADQQYIQVHSTLPTSLVVVGRSKGTPQFIAYRSADTALAAPPAQALQAAQVVHTTAFALSKEPARSVILNVIKTAAASGITVSVDWNFAPQIWGVDDGIAIFSAVMQCASLLKISVDDMERFHANCTSIDACKNFLYDYPNSAICLTAGKEGVWYRSAHRQEWMHKAALPVPQVVDTTGAGDAFWAGYLGAYLNGASIDSCVDNALAVAAQKISKEGPLFARK